MSKLPGQRCDQKNIWVASESPYVAPESPLQESPLSPLRRARKGRFHEFWKTFLLRMEKGFVPRAEGPWVLECPYATFRFPFATFMFRRNTHASDRPAVLCGASGVSPRLGFLGCCRGNGCGRRPQWDRFGGTLYRGWVVF